MRFTILTLYRHNRNFGGLLQAYALQKAVEAQGKACEVLSYRYCEPVPVTARIREALEEAAKLGFLPGIRFFVVHTAVKWLLSLFYKNRLGRRLNSFEAFEHSIPHSGKTYPTSRLEDCIDHYDGFICGGDQIWNKWHGSGKEAHGFTLEFVPDAKIKFSYAPSLGTAAHSGGIGEAMRPGLERLDYVSVREKSSASYIEKLCGKEVATVLDPVLLLPVEDWDAAINESSRTIVPERKYVLCYLLGNDKSQREAVRRFAGTAGLDVLTFPFIGGILNWNDIGFGDIRDFRSGPLEFVGLVSKAEMVLTDSFHGVVFSVIYGKDFYAFERSRWAGEDMMFRIRDFLDGLGLSDRIISAEDLLHRRTMEPVGYDAVAEIILRKRRESMAYLEKALKAKGGDAALRRTSNEES